MKIEIKGTIVANDDLWIYEYCEMDATSPRAVSEALGKVTGDITVEINSGGGDVFAGSEIYTAIKNYPGKVTVQIVGLAASAASVIAMAGDVIKISPTAQIMIHNVWSRSSGDYRDMEHAAEILKGANETIANAYRIKTGMAQEDLLELMNQETWLTPAKAKELGFVDEIMFERVQLVANIANILPNEVLEKIRETVKSPSAKLAEAKEKYLKLKGSAE